VTAGQGVAAGRLKRPLLQHHQRRQIRQHLDRITGFGAAVADLDERIAGKAARWQREAAG
jgi:hypothetical protein